MIYTLTLNPALDYYVETKELIFHKLNKIENYSLAAGGKGLNVSMMLSNIGVENTALGFVAGFTGDEILRQVAQNAKLTTCDFIKVDGLSRINIKLKNVKFGDSKETEINGAGPQISEADVNKLLEKIKKINSQDILILSGSVTNLTHSPINYYEKKVKTSYNLTNCQNLYANVINCSKSSCILVDSSGDSLRVALNFRPFFIKPNGDELGEFFGVSIKTKKDAEIYGKELLKLGAKNVLVSLGADGAVFLNELMTFEMNPLVTKIKTTVGCGDSMVAGFIAKILEEITAANGKKIENLSEENYKNAARYANAAAGATALLGKIGDLKTIEKLFGI